jgi:predicted transcriptional regulator
LWRLGPADAKTVHEALLAERPDASYATVLRQLQVMHGKGLLSRDESQRPQVYAPVQAQDKLQQSLVRDFIAKAFAGSGKALVLAALKSHVSAKERAEIRQLLARGGDDA